jgi:ribosomal protein S18 acetylase RimI-like enzyme
MTQEIRPFQPEDHAAAWALWQSTEGVGLTNASSYESVCRFLARNPGLSFVATDGQQVVGTILCGHDGRRGLIHSVAIAASHRRRGIARSLVTHALAGLRGAGIDKCHLLVFNDNAEGRAFWHGIGAEERTTLGLFSLTT